MPINYTLQDKFLDNFFSGPYKSDFYLTGGTCLTRFYFHHRESFDLDLFTQNQAIDFTHVSPMVEKIGRDMRWKLIKQVTTDTFLQYIYEDKNGQTVKTDLVKDIPVHFGKIKKIGKINIDSLENIGSNKILAIFGRTDAKDFIDLFHILSNTGFSFDFLYGLAKKKDLGLSEFYLANSINQLSKITQYPLMLKPLNKKEMATFYENLSRKLLLRIKPKVKSPCNLNKSFLNLS